jgi:hypothetical protein
MMIMSTGTGCRLSAGEGCGASSLAYVWMRSFRGSYIGRRDTVAG